MAERSVSIIICTRDRAESLRETLKSIGRCDVPADILSELVVVDNGATDHTESVISETKFHGAPVRRVLEPAAGLSRARNAGLHGTVSDVILFTDDDVRVPKDWIDGMCRPILQGQADAVAGGVRFPAHYEPLLSSEPLCHWRGWLASNEHWNSNAPPGLIGANMAFSRRVAESVGGFDPQLGAGALGFHEETLFATQLIAAGFRLRSALDVSLEHHFDLSRLTRKTLLDMAARMGRSSAYVDYHWEHNDGFSARTKLQRAALLLALEKIRAPWRTFAKMATPQETQRIQTLAYWRELASLAGQPRNYPRDTLPKR